MRLSGSSHVFAAVIFSANSGVVIAAMPNAAIVAIATNNTCVFIV